MTVTIEEDRVPMDMSKEQAEGFGWWKAIEWLAGGLQSKELVRTATGRTVSITYAPRLEGRPTAQRFDLVVSVGEEPVTSLVLEAENGQIVRQVLYGKFIGDQTADPTTTSTEALVGRSISPGEPFKRLRPLPTAFRTPELESVAIERCLKEQEKYRTLGLPGDIGPAHEGQTVDFGASVANFFAQVIGWIEDPSTLETGTIKPVFSAAHESVLSVSENV